MKTLLKDKRGLTLGDAYPAVLAIVLIGLVLGIGIYVLGTFREEVATEYTGSDNSINVSATATANTTTLSDATKDDYRLLSIDSVVNGSGTTIPSGFYNSTIAGVITWNETIVSNGTPYYFSPNADVNISSTYIYDASNSPEEAINDSLEGLAGFADWIAIIVVVIAAAIVLGIVLSSFGRRTPGV